MAKYTLTVEIEASSLREAWNIAAYKLPINFTTEEVLRAEGVKSFRLDCPDLDDGRKRMFYYERD